MARHLVITGLVQGVGYRYSLRREALRLGLAGWVRNRLDGSVEAMIEGPPDAMTALVDWAHRGPPSARVAGVSARDAGNDISFSGFEQLPTDD
jgi:acylphosphatase